MTHILSLLLFVYLWCSCIATTIKKSVWIDFDETISFKDTTDHVVGLFFPLNSEAQNIWRASMKKYTNLCAKSRAQESASDVFKTSYCRPSHLPDVNSTLTGKAITEMENGICQLNLAETNLYCELSKASIFRGVTKDQLFRHGMHVPGLHPFAPYALNSFLTHGLNVQILSLHWSTDYIRGALHQHMIPYDKITIHSSNFLVDPITNLTSGRIGLAMVNGIDKLRVFSKFVKENKSQLPTIFIGDAIHDFPPMLYADLGIWVESQGIQTNDFIRKKLKEGGVELLDLPTADSGDCPSKRELNKPRLYRTRSWKDISHVVIKCAIRTEE